MKIHILLDVVGIIFFSLQLAITPKKFKLEFFVEIHLNHQYLMEAYDPSILPVVFVISLDLIQIFPSD